MPSVSALENALVFKGALQMSSFTLLLYLSSGVEVARCRSQEERTFQYETLDLLVGQRGPVAGQEAVHIDAARQRSGRGRPRHGVERTRTGRHGVMAERCHSC